MKNYLILGASSAIAKYFIKRLKAEGNMVSTLSSSKGKNWVYEKNSIKNKIVESKPEVIINFVGTFTKDYSTSYTINVLVAKNLFDVAIEAEFDGKIVLIGSAAEYGIQNRYTEFCVEKPQSIYGLTKLMQYSLFKYYISTSHIKANYIRLFNVVDTHLSNELFIGNFTRQVKLALKRDIKEITLSNLNSYRDFLLIDDVYTGFMKVIKNGNNGGVYNLGMGEMILLDEFVEKVLSQLNLQLKLVIKKINSVGNIESKVVADIAKIRSVGWSPKFDYKSLIEEYSRRLKKEILNEKN